MSYILDALKKSEQERKRGEIPGLTSFQEQPRPPRSTSRILLYLLIAALLVNSLVLGLWAVFHQPEPPPTTAVTSEAPATEAATSTTPDTSASGPQRTAVVAPPAEAGPAGPQPEKKDGIEKIAAVEEGEVVAETVYFDDQLDSPPETGEDSADSDLGPEETPEESAAKPAKLTTFARLPPEVRADLPDLTIAAHYYANRPQARMASINGRIMRQGQKVQDDLTLEEITREGVIFLFRRYRFSMEVFSR